MGTEAERTKHDRAGLIGLGRELLQRVDQRGSEPFEVRGERMTNAAQVPTLHGISRHALRVGAVALDLYERDLTLEAMPLVRTVYEFGITACWVADSREGISAMYNEDKRHRRNLADWMEKSLSTAFREFAPTLRPAPGDSIETVAREQGKYFQARCEALEPGGADAYLLFRAMSAFCHPSASLADHYLAVDETAAGARLLTEPEQFDHDSWLFICLISMMWAARAMDVMNRDHPNRNYLRGLAKRLEVPDVLRLTPRARQAEVEAEQRRRRDGWVGPRRRSDRNGATRGEPQAP